MKRTVIILSTVAAVFIAGILWYRWDSETNHGYAWGYWGQFNTVSNSLVKLPGVTIVKFGCNADVTLEEFGFDIVTTEGRQVHVWFSEDDPIRKLSGEALSKVLLEKLRKGSSNKPAAGNAGAAPLSAIESHWPGVRDPECSATRANCVIDQFCSA